MTSSADTVFTGSVAQLYERHMVPLIFEPYAADLARRVADAAPRRVLELAAGTGVVTRQLALMLGASAEIVATDLNPAMIEEAARLGTKRPVEWKQVDAMRLPFADAAFHAVVCQFGVMFFPDKPEAFAEARRVLCTGGLFAFNAWGAIATSEFADATTDALATMFPQDPPRFMARTPHGYHDPARITHDLKMAGFTSTPNIETVVFTSRAVSPRIAAVAYCQGTPLRGEIETREPSRTRARHQDCRTRTGAPLRRRPDRRSHRGFGCDDQGITLLLATTIAAPSGLVNAQLLFTPGC